MYSVRAERQSDHAEIPQILIGLFRNTFGVRMFWLILCEGPGECFQKLVSNLPVTRWLMGCSTVSWPVVAARLLSWLELELLGSKERLCLLASTYCRGSKAPVAKMSLTKIGTRLGA